MNGPGDLSSYRFSTDALPERDRVGVWREFFGRHIAGLDLEPVGSDPLRVDIEQKSLNRISVARALVTAYRGRRTRELLGDGRHDKVLLMPGYRGILAGQRGRETFVREGEAVLLAESDVLSLEQAGRQGNGPPGRYLHVILPHEAVAALVPAVEDSVMHVIPAGNEALRLLRGYLGMLYAGDGLAGAYTARAVAGHVSDLAALAIGASADARELARRRGLGAARLARIQAYIRNAMTDPGLTLTAVARHVGVTPRYVRKLFAAEGTAFTDYLLSQRLERAGRMLETGAFDDLRISDIAYECGFGDLSYFNRAFRRRFSMTPSDMRAQSRARRS